MKISVNEKCPCGSKLKYKNCCQRFHKGALPQDALALMKSRYVAYVVGDAKYIIKTTHPDNPQYEEDKKAWQKGIESFSRENNFLNLKIDSFSEEKEYAYVTFKATFSEGELYEKSKFTKIKDMWFYLSGEIK